MFSKTILQFVIENPDYFGWRGAVKPDLKTDAGRKAVLDKMAGAFTTFNLPSAPQTVPDTAVVEILLRYYEVPKVNRTIKEHQDAMAAENFVGYLLEFYIFSEAYKLGWCLCPAAIVKSVDFVKLNEDKTWTMLQVKNRDNSENSSSKKVREGKDIMHWFRTFSKKTGSNWSNFPDAKLKKTLTEKGFFNFIDNYFKNR